MVQNPEIFRKWADIGLVMVMTGLEALDDEQIDSVDKRTSAAINERAIEILGECGIALSAGFLILPDFTEADFRRIDDYVRARPNIALTELTPLTPLPGTELHARQNGDLTTSNRELYDLAHFVLPTSIPQRQMYALLRKYYFRVIWRAIRRLKLYHPRYAFRPHIPRLIWGALQVGAMMRHAHQDTYAPAPQEV